MSAKVNDDGVVLKRVAYNSASDPVKIQAIDFSDTVEEHFHLERDGLDIKVVSDGFVDVQKEISSQAKNAGLVNILKMQELRYGSVENAIARNKDKQVFADVSKVPTSVAEQAEKVAETNAHVEKLCKELGITKDQLLSLTPEKYLEIKQAQAAAAAAAAASSEGGNE